MSQVNDLLDSLRWAVIQLEGELKAAKTENQKLEMQYQSIKQVEMDDVTRDQRSAAKAVNFGIIYGQSAFGLAQNLGISRTEAKQIIDI